MTLKSIAAIAAALSAYYFTTTFLFGYACPSEIVLGLPCPGCGLTRAAVFLCKGRISDSFQMNPMLIPGAVAAVLRIIASKAPRWERTSNICVWIFIASSLASFAWRVAVMPGIEPIVVNKDSLLFNAALLAKRLFS
jgi:hypothetical protein